MKSYKEYAIYIIDTDGSERKFGIFNAKSENHAKIQALKQGAKKISSCELINAK